MRTHLLLCGCGNGITHVQVNWELPYLPTLMTGALDEIISPQATFRLNAFRMYAKVDTSPSIETVQQLHQMLLAEVELGLGSGDQSKSPGTPAVKALQDKVAGSPAQSRNVCRFWKSSGGCREGALCRFQHPAHEDGKYHCYTCGATTHKKPDCPYASPCKEGKGQSTTGALQGSSAGGSGSGGGGKSSAGKGDGKGSPKGKGGKGANKEDQNKKSDTTGSKDDHKKNVKKVEADGGKEGSSDSKGSSGAGTGETSTLVTEVSSPIKTLKTPESSSTAYRHVKTVNIRKIDMGKNQRILIDGGASHVLRKARSQEEWDQGELIQVALASGTTDLKQDVVTGALLTLHGFTMFK